MSFLPHSRTTLLACSLAMIAVGLLGCGSGEPDPETDAWTVQEDAANLQRTLHVSDNEQFYFGNIHDVAVDDSGRIYVADGQAHHVKILSPDGSFIDSLGTQGRGPGEFERPSQVFFARDSLYVLDGYYGELSRFGPKHSFAYRTSLRKGRSTPHRIMPYTSDYVGVYSSLGIPDPENRKHLAVRTVTIGGTPEDTLFTVPPPQMHIEKMDRGIRMRSIPYAREPHIATGPTDRIHSTWSDSLTVVMYDRTGQPQDTVDIPYEPVPVTEADRERVLSEMSAESKAAIQNKIQPTKPAFDQFLVDNEGRYWFGRPTEDPDSTVWWIAKPGEKHVLTETLPSETTILTVKDGQAYGRTTTEMGAPALVRYRIPTSE